MSIGSLIVYFTPDRDVVLETAASKVKVVAESTEVITLWAKYGLLFPSWSGSILPQGPVGRFTESEENRMIAPAYSEEKVAPEEVREEDPAVTDTVPVEYTSVTKGRGANSAINSYVFAVEGGGKNSTSIDP